MKIRAAVLEEFGEPLVVQEVELAEPGPGEVLVRLVACGVCHTDLYTASGVDPSGYAPTVLGHEGAGVVERGRRRRRARSRRATTSSRCSRRSAASASTAASPRTNLCLAIREQQNKGYLPDGTTRLSRDGEPIRHFMGTSTFAEYTVMPRDRAREGRPRGAARPRLPVRLRPLDRPRRGDVHRQGRAGLDVRRLRRRAWSASARSPAAACRAPSGSSASTSPSERLELARGQGATDVDASAATDAVERDPRDDRRLRRRLHLRGDRQRRA